VSAANIAFEGSRQESRLGLRSTLDVLIAEQNLTSAQLSLLGARHDEYVAAGALLSAIGLLFPQDFAPDVRIYDPKVNLRQVRGAWPWTPWSPAVEGLDGLDAPRIVNRPDPPPTPR
jgi:outer membrane protein